MEDESWTQVLLGDLVTLQRGHDLPEKKRQLGEVPILGSFGITGWHNKSRARGPGVTVGRSGASYGVVNYSKVDYWPLNTALYVTEFHGNDERFIYYLLKQFDFRRYNSGSAQPSLNRNFLYPAPVTIPPLPEQRAIAHILGTLDDKIELNRKMNRTLEEIAQTLFRAWFVDFEGHDDLVDSELGPIPQDWVVRSLGELVEHIRDTVEPQVMAEDTPYIGLGDMPAGSLSIGHWGRATDVTSTKHNFRKGDILFGKLRPYFKKVVVAPVDGICSSDILVLRPRAPKWFGLVLGLLIQDAFIAFTERVSSGTRMPRVNWKTMAGYKIAIPEDPDPIRRFNDLIVACSDRINHSILESRTLAALRDTLLPKLISGEIRIPEAAEVVEDATDETTEASG